jgi:hypothetical protein
MPRLTLPALLIGFVALGWWLAPYLQQQLRGAEAVSLLDGADCRQTDADGAIHNQWPCSSAVSNGDQLTLTLGPANTPPLAVLAIQLRYQGNALPDDMRLRFEGEDMYMGETPVFLKRSEFDPTLWEGNGSLAICTRERMTWRATASLYQGSNVIEVPFRFDAVAPTTD